MILKRMRGTKIFMLVHPVPMNGTVHVSLIWHKDDAWYDTHGHVFKTLLRFGDHYFTEFVTFKEEKLENLLSTECRMFSVCMQSTALHDLNILKKENLFHPADFRAARCSIQRPSLALGPHGRQEDA